MHAPAGWARRQGLGGAEAPLPESLRAEVRGSLEYPARRGPFRLPVSALALWLAQAVGVQTRPGLVGLLRTEPRR